MGPVIRACCLASIAVSCPASLNAKTQPPPQAYFAMSPRDVAAKLSGMCMDAGLSVMGADDRQVLCAKEVSGFKGALTQMLIGNSYSTTPTDNIRFQLIPWNEGTRTQVSEWLETQMAFGQVRRVPITGGKATNQWLTVLYRLGGTTVPALQIQTTPVSVAPIPVTSMPATTAPITPRQETVVAPASPATPAKPKKPKSVGVICVTCE